MGIFINPFAYTLGGGQGTAPAAGGPDDTQNYVEVTIAASQVGSTLTDFPTYVDLSDLPAAFFTGVQSDGGDIRVTESDGTTQAPVDLVAIDTGASTGELHFLASSLSSSTDTVYRIYYNASSTISQPAVGGTYGRNAVWADYGYVGHLEDDASLIDSTGNGFTGTVIGNVANAAGKLGQGLTFDGSGDRVALGDGTELDATTDLTVQAWTYFDNSDNAFVVAKRDGSSLAYWFDVNSGALRWSLDDGTSHNLAGSTFATSTWYLYHGTYDGTNQTLYRDGSQDATTAAGASGSLTNSTASLTLGDRADGTAGAVHTGDLDEVRVRLSALSADWIASEYTNQNTPTTFYTVGSEQAA